MFVLVVDVVLPLVLRDGVSVGICVGFPTLQNVRLVFGKVYWIFVILGGLGLAAFGIVFAIEMRQDSAKIPRYERDLREKIGYDPQTQYAVIRSSICTGEKVAGFKNKKNGQFTEVMVIRTPEDEERFRRIFGLESVKTEY